MKVIVPTTRHQDKVAEALDSTGYQWERADVSVSDDAYWELLRDLWHAGDTFAIIEHDVIVEPGTLRALEECLGSWCAFGTPYVGTVWAGLSCVKFTAELIARQPQALEIVGEMSDSTHPAKHYCRLDAWLQGTLAAGGEDKCTHQPPLEHLRDYPGPPQPSHECWR